MARNLKVGDHVRLKGMEGVGIGLVSHVNKEERAARIYWARLAAECFYFNIAIHTDAGVFQACPYDPHNHTDFIPFQKIEKVA